MSEVNTVVVKRHEEESARRGVFWERDHQHQLADPEAWPEGEVWIADDEEHTIAKTSGVMGAVRALRLVIVDEETVTVDPEEIAATDAARELAEEAGLDLADVVPTGADGQVVKSDVEKAIAAAKDSEPQE